MLRRRIVGTLVCAFMPAVGGCFDTAMMRRIARDAGPTPSSELEARRTFTHESPTDIDLPGDGAVVTLIINGEKITAEDVLRPMRHDLEKQAAEMTRQRYLEYLVMEIQDRVRMMARDTLLYQAASQNLNEQDTSYIDGLVDQEIRRKVTREFAGRQTRFEQSLNERGLTLADERANTFKKLVIARWLQLTIHRKVTDPTRDQLWRLYKAREAEYSRPPQRDMRIIEIEIADVTCRAPADDGGTMSDVSTSAGAPCRCATHVRALADRAHAELAGGADFADVAQRYSTAWHKSNGGQFGMVTRGSVRKRLEPAVDALFKLKEVGVCSPVIETGDACFIVQAAEIDTGEQPDFASLQPELIKQFRDEQFDRLVEKYVGQLHEDAQIEPQNINRFLQGVAEAAPRPAGA